MVSSKLRSRGVVPLAIAGPVALGVSLTLSPETIAPETTAGVKTVHSDVTLLDRDTELWGMGGSGTPIPSQSLIDEILTRFVNPDPVYFPEQHVFPTVDSTHPLFTPEGLYPVITGVKSLTLDESVNQGVKILDNTIWDRLDAGSNVVVGGGSQSSTIQSIEMRNLLALPEDQQPDADRLSFMLLVDPSNPNGGLLERFGDESLPPLTIPSFGVTFSGATPGDTPWETAEYNVEYDGFSDFPRYPLNIISDLNAGIGILAVHPEVRHLSDELTESIVQLPVSDAAMADPDFNTDYYMVPTDDLPLLEALRFIPTIGGPLADLIEPDLKVLVNLGYGQIDHGWDPGPADIPTPFGLFPDVDLGDVLTALGDGAKQGIQDFMDDIEDLGSGESLPSLADMSLSDLPSLTEIVNAFSAVAGEVYQTLLPLADTANAVVSSLPMYAMDLAAQGISEGNLIDAIGMPIAADFGLSMMAYGFGIGSIARAVKDIIPIFDDLMATS